MDIKFPIRENELTNFERVEFVNSYKQKLKHLLLTNKGERIMIPDFGVGIKKYLFTTITDSQILADFPDGSNNSIQNEIEEQVSKYIPEIKIISVDLNNNQSNLINIIIKFQVFGFTDTLQIVA